MECRLRKQQVKVKVKCSRRREVKVLRTAGRKDLFGSQATLILPVLVRRILRHLSALAAHLQYGRFGQRAS